MDIEKLIKLVYETECLWNAKNKSYHNREIARQKWQDISKEMDASVEAVKTKWRGLRDTFRKELHKTKQKQLVDGRVVSSCKEPVWSYFKDLMFLEDQCSSKYMQYMYDSESSVEDFECVMVDENSNSDSDDELLSALKNKKRKRRKGISSEHTKRFTLAKRSTANENPIYLQEDKHNLNDDADYHFLMSLLPTMRKIPDDRKLITRIKLQQVLCDEEMYKQPHNNQSHQPSFTFSSVNNIANERISKSLSARDSPHSFDERPISPLVDVKDGILPLFPDPHKYSAEEDREEEEEDDDDDDEEEEYIPLKAKKSKMDNEKVTLSTKRHKLKKLSAKTLSPRTGNSSANRDEDIGCDVKLTHCNEVLLRSGKYFQIVECEASGSVVGECHMCRTKIKASLQISSNFVRHLKNKHNEKYEEFLTQKGFKACRAQIDKSTIVVGKVPYQTSHPKPLNSNSEQNSKSLMPNETE